MFDAATCDFMLEQAIGQMGAVPSQQVVDACEGSDGNVQRVAAGLGRQGGGLEQSGREVGALIAGGQNGKVVEHAEAALRGDWIAGGSLDDYQFGSEEIEMVSLGIPPLLSDELVGVPDDIGAWPSSQVADYGRFDVNRLLHDHPTNEKARKPFNFRAFILLLGSGP